MNNLFSLDGKTVLVTGASSGLGRQFAKTLAAAGANVVAVARRRERLDELREEITAAGGRALGVCADVTDSRSVRSIFDEAERQFGVVSVVINNAGISRPAPLRSALEEDWDAVIEANLKAVWLVAAEASRRMVDENQGGSIVNIASILAFGAAKALGPYMASKAGVVQLTRSMALEWASDNIRVNAIAPGYFPTEMTGTFFSTPKGLEMIERIPQRRIGDPVDLNGPLLLLASDASSYMTGSVITVDGGHLCHSL
jgi:NAD(P)-dependent dehydrogenase (short-subunit alcohol dehydrogenase family)